jgi:flagellar hook protein FlgE
MPSFNVSIVSNLGEQNAIADIKLSYNNVPHEAMFSGETEYAEPQGGSGVVTLDFYDSLGNPKTATLRMTMVSQDSDFTTWRWYADSADDSDFGWQADETTQELISNLNVGTGLIRFDKNGNYVKGADFSETGGITINQEGRGVNEPIVISLINKLSSRSKQDLDFSELTCSATSNSFKLSSQNGRPPGTLNDFTVSLDGVIQGVYSNGNVVSIARIGLAMIPNENGLIAAGTNLFHTGPASGDAQYGHAYTGGNGKIRHMQLESSNVDLSEEFTKMISIERGFQANSRIITTADEMITELLNLKR